MPRTIYRATDMSVPSGNAYTSATLTFDYRRANLDATSDYVALELSSNGTVGPFVERYRVQGGGTDSSYRAVSVDIPASDLGANTVLRLSSSGLGSSDYVYIDNIELTLNYAPIATYDYGDWNGAGAATTTARSLIDSRIKLGPTTDGESGVSPNATATADGADEDGVTLPSSWSLGQAQNFVYVVTNITGSDVYLKTWIDYNNDGDFEDYGELVVNGTVGTGNSNSTLYYAVTPVAAGTNLGVRTRLSSDADVSPTSTAGTGEIEDYVVSIAAIGSNQSYTWTMDNANEDWTVDPVTELEPDATMWWPNINGESFGTIRSMSMSYNPTTKELRGEIRLKCYSGSRPFQGFWMALSDGPIPRGNDRAILYYDGYDANNPKMTMYVYDGSQSENSWSNPGKLLSSSVTSAKLQPGPMVNEGSNYFRVQFNADLSSVNVGENFPTFNLPKEWNGMRFGSEVGVSLHFFKFNGQPTYNASGALTAFPVDNTTLDSGTGYHAYTGWFDTGYWPALLRASLDTATLDYGDYQGFPIASQTASTEVKIGSAATDSDIGPALGGD
ncbi:MAG: hypothetical protein KDK97_22660, partial [Verrucomicrobiales bacterium]|nr:hypothetical protein [Verrucomicrobiales bacterium]